MNCVGKQEIKFGNMPSLRPGTNKTEPQTYLKRA